MERGALLSLEAWSTVAAVRSFTRQFCAMRGRYRSLEESMVQCRLSHGQKENKEGRNLLCKSPVVDGCAGTNPSERTPYWANEWARRTVLRSAQTRDDVRARMKVSAALMIVCGRLCPPAALILWKDGTT
ncbi:uncharacterized protein F5Z01DRAFT_232750 [Emericellopsis atlantica]|uniref:Uncharacterized protein n=1 Tax=Emericellopsis atlantica TaxID=2614577 RepID=A0A9P7ZI78_9HYPO|nr:uncharacterized protein F5Z01DRAFT_232750 [Emericellopsis atlantica]KAG9252534.1 hypothetical protein F5Z01DRAFT_232750 [Emericellopsis atlantica]